MDAGLNLLGTAASLAGLCLIRFAKCTKNADLISCCNRISENFSPG